MENTKARHKLFFSLLLAALAMVAIWGCSGGSSSNGDDNSGDTGDDADAGECAPSCGANDCGDDGCGGTCGECSGDAVCVSGKCESGCSNDCTGKECGNNDCGTSCGACALGYECNSGLCELDLTGKWTVTLTTGTISETDPSDEAWDVPGGMPDAFVCVTVDGQEACSPTADDTLSPNWDHDFGTVAASDLVAGVEVSIWDEDLSDDDVICGEGTIAVKNEDFASGHFDAECEYAVVNFSLSAVCTVGEACGAGKACYYYADGFACLTAGTKDIGEPCGAAADCTVGATCLDGGDGMYCFQVCSGANPCGGNSSCEDTGFGFKVCVAN
ncbi:MAG: hypothetical protein HY897_22280 [Deltaproteobacteria bacterium]|nr:hypothetical protein [Deltaproteobacteria bacterium]